MSTRTRADAQTFTHDNYSTSGTPATKTLPAHTSSILIVNTDGTDSVLVSFDGGTTYLTITHGNSLSLECDGVVSYKVKSSANTPAAQCLYGSEA